MANETKIRPALTPEEWAERTLPARYWASHPWDGSPARWCDSSDWALWINEDHTIGVAGEEGLYPEQHLAPEKVTALANAALPDDDPRKITRADVEWIQKLLYDRGWDANEPGENEPEWSHQRDTLAAKLAAFLPPE